MKKKTRRSEAPYPALDPNLNLKTRRDQNDLDYLETLPETWTDPKTGKTWTQAQLKQYLNDFQNEYLHTDFETNVNQGRKRIHKKRKVEHEKNNHLKKVLADFLDKIKEFVIILNDSQINITSKTKIKKSLNKYKRQLEKEIKEEFRYIQDYYKKIAEDSNNGRNRCILTRSAAQGKSRSLDALSENYLSKGDMEEEILNKIERERSETEE